MKLVFIHLILLVIFAVDVQGQTRRSDTISVKISMCNSIRGDTVMFNCSNGYEGLKRFIYRNLHYPLDSMQTILCKLFFVINKDGFVSDAWCAPGPPDAVAKEVVRVARKIGSLKPGYIKGKPVVTRVETDILFFYRNGDREPDNCDDYEKDILVLMWGCRLPAKRSTVH